MGCLTLNFKHSKVSLNGEISLKSTLFDDINYGRMADDSVPSNLPKGVRDEVKRARLDMNLLRTSPKNKSPGKPSRVGSNLWMLR